MNVPATIPDYYAILGVPQSASAEEIKNAYRRQAQIWHPDKNMEPNAPEMFRAVRQAFDFLSDEATRRSIDVLLTAQTRVSLLPRPDEVNYGAMPKNTMALTTEGYLVRE